MPVVVLILPGNKPNSGVSLALQEYLLLAKRYYSAEPQSVDFVGAADAIRREINSSVEQQTEGKFQLPVFPLQIKKESFWLLCAQGAHGR